MTQYNTPKKAQYHGILTDSGPTSYNVVKALTDGFKQPIPQALEKVRGYYRYLTHKDNPETAQYEEREIKTINGFNIADLSELTSSEITQKKKTLQAPIRQYDIGEYAQLMDFLPD
ncbi:Rep family protein, partial [Clostridioides difficile]|uniref:Rep family protein n=1 Tax=Clostridioides difficile TaxID=1496 RepID=UPI000BCCC756